MNGKWIEIFRGGRQVDSAGSVHDGDSIIDRAVANFNAGDHEPPIVVGHPRMDGPAFGWIEELKTEARDGVRVLLAKARQVVPEFAEMVHRGLFKKRSAAFYPDGRLRHVGFLGAQPPAVKGLADIGFTGGEEYFEFAEEADDGTPSPATHTPAAAPEKLEADDMPKTPEELQAEIDALKREKDAAIEAAKAEVRQEAAAEFAEKEATAKRAAEIKEFSDWLTRKVEQGAIPPGIASPRLREFAESLDASAVLEFSEGEKKPQLAAFREFLEAIFDNDTFSHLFAETATKDKAGKKKKEDEEDEENAKDIAKRANKGNPFAKKEG